MYYHARHHSYFLFIKIIFDNYIFDNTIKKITRLFFVYQLYIPYRFILQAQHSQMYFVKKRPALVHLYIASYIIVTCGCMVNVYLKTLSHLSPHFKIWQTNVISNTFFNNELLDKVIKYLLQYLRLATNLDMHVWYCQ